LNKKALHLGIALGKQAAIERCMEARK